jgi:hypothetical protein
MNFRHATCFDLHNYHQAVAESSHQQRNLFYTQCITTIAGEVHNHGTLVKIHNKKKGIQHNTGPNYITTLAGSYMEYIQENM